MKHERKCSVCGKTYQYCPNCSSYESYPRWMFLFDSENCKNIFETVSDYNQGIIDAKAARIRINKCDLKKAEPLMSGTKEGVNKILKETAATQDRPAVEQKPERTPVNEEDSRVIRKKHSFINRNKTEDSDKTTEALS